MKKLIVLLILVGCATTQYEVEWINGPEHNLQTDTYDCETIIMKRRSGNNVYDQTDIISNGMGFEVNLNKQIDECLIIKYGWTRIVRNVK